MKQNDLFVSIIVKDRRGGKVAELKNMGFEKGMAQIEQIVGTKYRQRDDKTPPLIMSEAPAWLKAMEKEHGGGRLLCYEMKTTTKVLSMITAMSLASILLIGSIAGPAAYANPPGIPIKPCEYLTNITLRTKK